MKCSRVLLFTAAAIAGFTTGGLAAEQIFTVTGVIRGQLDDGQLAICHDEIPGYMPAMTMAFVPGNPADAVRLKAGDRVRFRYRVNETKSTAEQFMVIGREAMLPTSATKSKRLRAGDAVPIFSLTDQNDQLFTSAALRDRLTIVTFIFTRCPVPEFCPAMALRFGELQKAILADPRLAARARLLSITLDPEFDRPEILTAYGKAVGADPAIWQFATGTKEEIAALTKAFAVYNERNGATLDHTLSTALVGPDGRVIELWRGNGWHIGEVLKALGEQDAKSPIAACYESEKS
jgi:protein SCO1